MSNLSQAIEQLENAVDRAETASENYIELTALELLGQQDLFEEELKKTSLKHAENSTWINPNELEQKLSSVIGKMEQLLETA